MWTSQYYVGSWPRRMDCEFTLESDSADLRNETYGVSECCEWIRERRTVID